MAKVKQDKLATVVKIADLNHNSDLSRLEVVTPADMARHDKYFKAIEFLNGFTCAKCRKSYTLSLQGEKPTRIKEILCKPCLEQYEIDYDEYEDWLKRERD